MITKNDVVLEALEELRISGLTVTPSPEEIVSAIKRLDNMVLGWQNKGLCLGYIPVDESGIDPEQNSGLLESDKHAVVINLAKSLCPMYGAPLHPDTRAEAKASYLGLFSSELTMKESNPYMPNGSGKSFGYYCANSFQPQENAAPQDCETKDIKVGEIGFYTHDFNRYLDELEGDTITSYVIEDGEGVSILGSSEDSGIITMQAKGLTVGLAPILITITTSSGRVNPETINFNVTES